MSILLKRLVLVAALAVTFNIPAALAAGRNVGSGLIGNTVELTGPAGTTKIYYTNSKTLIVHTPDGKKTKGWWRVKGRSICTRVGEKPENCTEPMVDAPVAGNSGVITSPEGDIKWTVTKGRGF